MNQTSDEEGSVPHYMLPNFSSILPEYANAEAEHIKSAFSTGNYHSLLKMPARLGPNSVNMARQEAMDENRHTAVALKAPPKIVTKNGLFNQFEYTPSRFNLSDELHRAERLESEAKRFQIGGKDFVCSSNAKKLKHEDGFEDKNFVYPHMDVYYDDAHDIAVRERWIEKKKILYHDFVPSGAAKPIGDTPTKKLLPDIIKELHEAIANDWEDCTVVVAPTDDGNIAIQFDLDTVSGLEHALTAYMNTFANTHRLMAKFQLHKVVEDWNVKPGDNGLYFVVRPPWIRNPHAPMFTSLSIAADAKE
ncbi:hypothetical protein SPRG_15318 [Saprolegnia parasitica CBS 223.65]|uniref:Uncharacterized protein n=1 Tax=Saprolegnia parasitica (strain CBS 223.65) TaxID=695850 RepID=A0A067BJ78_SAPPC|nr:hypothetical protein SPRG_15318 [Saprolegnia parasitica CBS 223.65]KDO18489.1 hypothetical protein SPRG_15318 [Saprolegnia parasitica CBS 223.65]|eukprot:XP_012210808.1 hypothetical protein SPRG_15318 [Saprolegnia parasitica CBS 223.65]